MACGSVVAASGFDLWSKNHKVEKLIQKIKSIKSITRMHQGLLHKNHFLYKYQKKEMIMNQSETRKQDTLKSPNKEKTLIPEVIREKTTRLSNSLMLF